MFDKFDVVRSTPRNDHESYDQSALTTPLWSAVSVIGMHTHASAALRAPNTMNKRFTIIMARMLIN